MKKANLEAKKERHQRLYDGQYHSFLGKLSFHSFRLFREFIFHLKPAQKTVSEYMHPMASLPAPKRLYTQLATWGVIFALLSSLNMQPVIGYSEGASGVRPLQENELDYFVSDSQGYLVKSLPLEGVSVVSQNRKDKVTHEIMPGETISEIAFKYGVNIESLLYANPGLNVNRIRPGQQLTVPPKNGIYVTIAAGDSLIKLIEDYKGNFDLTKAFNDIDEGDLVKGREIFIVEGKPKAEPVFVAQTKPRNTGTKTGNVGGGIVNTTPSYQSLPVSSQGWVRPTAGIITQGYQRGHLAYDVADRSKPPIVAASGGTVIKASAGGWGGGYGNHIIIDHGDGYQTLYAHAEELYVNVGDVVTQGQVIAKMGRTGNVRGLTGIHLHFELTYKGVKQNPSVMGVW